MPIDESRPEPLPNPNSPASVEPGDPTHVARTVQALCGRILDCAEVDRSLSFFELGGNSFSFIHFVAAIDQEFGTGLTAESLLQCRSLDEVAALVTALRSKARPSTVKSAGQADPKETLDALTEWVVPRQELVSGAVELTPNRYSLFFLKRRELHYWNVTATLELCMPVDHAAVARAVRDLVAHHDGLRLQGRGRASDWQEFIVPPERCDPLITRRYGASSSDTWQMFVERSIEEVSGSFSLPGELFRLLCIENERTRECVLFFCLHHLLADGYSASLVRHDFFRLYAAYERNVEPQLPNKTTSLIDYAAASRRYWLLQRETELEYWRRLPWHALKPLPVDFGSSELLNIEKYTHFAVRRTEVDDAASYVRGFSRGGQFTFVDVLLAAIAKAYSWWTTHEVLHIAAAFHGRTAFLPGMDVTRTVGWFTETVPLLLPGQLSPFDLLRETHRQAEHANTSGKSYGVLRYLSSDDELQRELGAHPQAPLSVNILLPGRHMPLDPRLVRWATQFRQPEAERAGAQRVYLLSGGVYFSANTLHVSWDFSSQLFGVERVEAFAERCLHEFAKLAALALESEPESICAC